MGDDITSDGVMGNDVIGNDAMGDGWAIELLFVHGEKFHSLYSLSGKWKL